MSLAEDLVLTLMEYFAFIFLVFRVAGRSIREFYKPILLFAAAPLITEVLKAIVNDFVITLIFFIAVIFFLKLVFKKNLLISIFMFLVAWSLLFFLQILFTFMLFYIGCEILYIFQIGIFVMTLTLITSILCYFFVQLHRVTEAAEEKKEFAFILIAISLFLTAISYYFAWQLKFSVFQNYEFLAAFVLIILGVYYTTCLILEMKAKSAAMEKYNDFERLVSNFKTSQPEFDNHLKALYYLALIDENLKTSKHIKEYLSDIHVTGALKNDDANLLCLERKAFAAYLHVKMTQLKAAGVGCIVNIWDLSISAKIKDCALVEAVGILIDNAWEATDENKNHVIINIVKEKDGKAAIEVLNKWDKFITAQEFFRMCKKGYSTKETGKGFGLYKLQKILDENNCELSFKNREIDGERYVSFKLIL